MKLRNYLLGTILFCFFVNLSQVNADSIIDPGLGDKVLSAITNVVTDSTKQIGLDILKEEITKNVAGVVISYNAVTQTNSTNSIPVSLYIGFSNAQQANGSPVTTDIYFQDTYNLLHDNDLIQFTDPALLGSIVRDSLSLLFRLTLRNVTTDEISKYHLRDFSNFVYTTIQIISRKNSTIYEMSDPCLTLADAIDKDNGGETTRLVGMKFYQSKFCEEWLRDRVDNPTEISKIKNVAKAGEDPLAGMGVVVRNLTSEKNILDDIPKLPTLKQGSSLEISAVKDEMNKYLVVFKRINVASVTEFKNMSKQSNGLDKLALLLRIIGKTLAAMQVDGPNTKNFFRDLQNQVDMSTVPNLLPPALNDHSYGNVVADLQTEFISLWGNLNLLTDGGNKAQNDLVRLISDLSTVDQNVSSDPAEIVFKLKKLMNEFASVLNLQTDIQNPLPVTILSEISNIMEDVANQQWVSLATEIVNDLHLKDDTGAAIKSGLNSQTLAFFKIVMAMYQAPTVADAQKILEGNIETLATRKERYFGSPDISVDLTSIFGWTVGNAGAVFNNNQNGLVSGVYFPVGFQFSIWDKTHLLSLMAYPFDLGGYVTGEGTDVRFQDAFRSGLAGYLRLPSPPIDFGVAMDYQEARSSWRALMFIGLETPLLPLN